MATNTPNLNLVKPATSDKMKDTITALASNMDTLDSHIHNNDNQIGNLSSFVNVKAFGAKGDTVVDANGKYVSGTDDTAAILSAIAYCQNNPGKRIYFPEGIYTFSSQLALTKNIVLFGAGQRRTQLLFTETSGIAVQVTSGSGEQAQILDMLINYNGDPTTTSVEGVQVYGASMIMRNVEIRNFTTLLEISDGIFSSFYDCVFQGYTTTRISKGIKLTTHSSSFSNLNTFKSCYIKDTHIAIQNSGAQENTFSSCAIENTDLFLHIETPTGFAQYIDFNDCWYENIPSPGIVNAGIDENTLTPLSPIVRKIGYDHVRITRGQPNFTTNPILDTTVNAGFSDNFDYVNGFSYKYTPQDAWTACTLQNGWVNYGGNYDNASYFKDKNGIVHFKGMIMSGTTTTLTALFNLPIGYRPSKYLYFSTASRDATAGVRPTTIELHPNGDLVCSQNVGNQWLALDGISFRAES